MRIPVLIYIFRDYAVSYSQQPSWFGCLHSVEKAKTTRETSLYLVRMYTVSSQLMVNGICA